MMPFFQRLRAWLEYLEGAVESPPVRLSHRGVAILMGLWWAVLATLVAIFCGQTSKFIYIDF